MTDIIIRDCGAAYGFVGIVELNHREIYRTGKHYPSAIEAFHKACEWIEGNMEEYNVKI